MNEAEREGWLEKGRLLFAGECAFMLSVAKMDDLPDDGFPEVAFAGRSNVGKSSIINALTNRGKLAMVSVQPGRTQLLNFFDLGGRVRLVDMPGYGYAQASKSLIRNWNRLIMDYLKGRVNLRRVFLLIDSRHGIKDNDRGVMDTLDKAAVVFQIVLTKTDKLKSGELEKVMGKVKEELANHTAAYPEIIATSSVKKTGLEDLRAAIGEFA